MPEGGSRWPTTVRVDPSAYVAATAILAGSVEVSALASIWYGTVLEGSEGPVVVGAGSSLQDRAVARGLAGFPLWIEEDVTVGHCAMLVGCRIGRGAVVGLNAAVLPGAVIGPSCLVAAGSVVPAGLIVPAGMLVAGNPAAIKKPLAGRSLQWQSKAAEDYQRLSRRYLERDWTPPPPRR